MYNQNLRKSPLLTPDAELLAPAPPTINHSTIENQSPRIIQQITTLQIPQAHDMKTIRQSIEHFSLPSFTGCQDLYDFDSDALRSPYVGTHYPPIL